MAEADSDTSASSGTDSGTSDTASSSQSSKSGYPAVDKWESGITRGPANPIGITKWSDVVGTKLTRGHANPLNEQPDSRFGLERYGYNPDKPETLDKAVAKDREFRDWLIKPKNGQPLTLDKFMEEYRGAIYSPSGIAIEAFLTAFEVTAPAVVISYAGLLGYDLYQVSQGQTDWLNIIFDTLGVVSSGILSGVLSNLMKSSKPVCKTIVSAFEWLSKQKVWKAIEPYVMKLAKYATTIFNWLLSGIKWVANKLGITWLLKMASKLNSSLKPLFDYIENITQKGLSILGASEKVAQVGGNSAKIFAQQSAIFGGAELTIKGITKGLEYYLNNKMKNKIKNNVLNLNAVSSALKDYILQDNQGLFTKDDTVEIVRNWWREGDIAKMIVKIKKQNYLLQVSNKDYIYKVTPMIEQASVKMPQNAADATYVRKPNYNNLTLKTN